MDAPDFAPAPRDVRVGVQGLDEVVLRALDADDGDVYLRQHRSGINVSQRAPAKLYPPSHRDWVVHRGVDVQRQRGGHLCAHDRRESASAADEHIGTASGKTTRRNGGRGAVGWDRAGRGGADIMRRLSY